MKVRIISTSETTGLVYASMYTEVQHPWLQPPSQSFVDCSMAKPRLQACQTDHDCGSWSYEGPDPRRPAHLLHLLPKTGVQAGQGKVLTVNLVTACDALEAALSYC